jgi:uncharacterized membrane protein
VDPLTLIHVAFGTMALLSGAAALSLRKGSRLHGKAGTWFFAAMLVMTATGSTMAALKPERGPAVIGLLTFYLVATSWATVRRRDGKAGLFELVAFLVAIACGLAMLSFGLRASASPNGLLDSLPASAHYPFAALAALAAALDLNFMLRGGVSGVQRIARHLWRMCAALLIAAFSFFLGQQDEFPEAWRGALIWFLPPLSVFAAMIFWILRVRFSSAFAWVAPRRAARARSAGLDLTAAASAAKPVRERGATT